MGFTAVADLVMGSVADAVVTDVVASAVTDAVVTAGLDAAVGGEVASALAGAGLADSVAPSVANLMAETGLGATEAAAEVAKYQSWASQAAASVGGDAATADAINNMLLNGGTDVTYEKAVEYAQSGLASIPQSQWGWQDYAKAAQMGLNLASGVRGLAQPAGKTQTPTQAQLQSDPWSKYRAGYGDQLNALMANPALTMTTPGYQFMKQQGLQTLTAGQAARGQVQSGAGAAAQQMFGANYAMSAYDKMINQYSGLAGAGISPAVGGSAYTAAQQSAQNAQMAGLGTIAGTIGSIANIYGGGTNTSNYGTVSVPQTPTNIISGNTGSSVDWYGF
jgi:hypothetical protein